MDGVADIHLEVLYTLLPALSVESRPSPRGFGDVAGYLGR